jgi:hypothetical protein
LAVSIAISEFWALTVAEKFIIHWYGQYGAPASILSDNGFNFNSELLAETMAIFNIRHVFTYHLQTNGVVKLLNGTFTSTAKKFMNEDQTDWDIHLPFIARAYNTSIHETIKVSPHCVVFGSEPESILDIFLALDGTHDFNTVWGTKMREVHDSVLDNLREKQDILSSKLSATNELSEFFCPFAIGNIVWLRNNATVGEHKELKHDFKQLGFSTCTLATTCGNE